MPRYRITAEFSDDAKARLRMGLKMMGATAVRIEEVKGEEAARPVKPDNKPTCPIAIAVAALFGRKPDQVWSDTEISIFKAARNRKVITLQSIEIMTVYYKAERKKGPEGLHRRDLLTWLRHVDGENDRALAFSQRAKPSSRGEWLPSSPKIVALPELTEEERIEAERFTAQMRAREAR